MVSGKSIIYAYAALAASTFAQSNSTYPKVGGVAIHGNCVCPSPVVRAVTIVINNGVTSTLSSSPSASAAPASTCSTTYPCPFTLSVNGTTGLMQIGDGQIQAHPEMLAQIGDGQIQAGSGLLEKSTFTLQNGQILDQAGRICSISGQNQSQFQCNYVPTTGSTVSTFSICDGALAFNGNSKFYACVIGTPAGYNIYSELTGNQAECRPISLNAPPCPSASAVAPVVPAITASPVALPVVQNRTSTAVATIRSTVLLSCSSATPTSPVSNLTGPATPVSSSVAPSATSIFAGAASTMQKSAGALSVIAATFFALMI